MVNGTKAAGMAIAALALSACGGGQWVKNEQHSTAYYQRLARCQVMASQSSTPEAVDVCMQSAPVASDSNDSGQAAERNTDDGYQRTSPAVSDTGDVDQSAQHSQAPISQDQLSNTGDNVTQSDVTTNDSEASTQPDEDDQDQDSSSVGIFPAIGHFIAEQAGNLKDSAMAALSAGSDAGGSVAKGAGDAGKAATEGAGDAVEGSDTQAGADEATGTTSNDVGNSSATATDAAGKDGQAVTTPLENPAVIHSVSNQGVSSAAQQAGWLEKGNGISL